MYIRSWVLKDVLGLEDQVIGLEASSPPKLPCPRLEDSTIFWTVEVLLENARNLAENLQRPFRFRLLVIAWKILLKTFFWIAWKVLEIENLFFLENTCACVLGPWPWPRAFLFLTSRGSVLKRTVLGLGLGFFLCPWPWLRLVSSTPSLIYIFVIFNKLCYGANKPPLL